MSKPSVVRSVNYDPYYGALLRVPAFSRKRCRHSHVAAGLSATWHKLFRSQERILPHLLGIGTRERAPASMCTPCIPGTQRRGALMRSTAARPKTALHLNVRRDIPLRCIYKAHSTCAPSWWRAKSGTRFERGSHLYAYRMARRRMFRCGRPPDL
jgi:hypothetical protein